MSSGIYPNQGRGSSSPRVLVNKRWDSSYRIKPSQDKPIDKPNQLVSIDTPIHLRTSPLFSGQTVRLSISDLANSDDGTLLNTAQSTPLCVTIQPNASLPIRLLYPSDKPIYTTFTHMTILTTAPQPIRQACSHHSRSFDKPNPYLPADRTGRSLPPPATNPSGSSRWTNRIATRPARGTNPTPPSPTKSLDGTVLFTSSDEPGRYEPTDLPLQLSTVGQTLPRRFLAYRLAQSTRLKGHFSPTRADYPAHSNPTDLPHHYHSMDSTSHDLTDQWTIQSVATPTKRHSIPTHAVLTIQPRAILPRASLPPLRRGSFS